jgi:hypothetical protein
MDSYRPRSKATFSYAACLLNRDHPRPSVNSLWVLVAWMSAARLTVSILTQAIPASARQPGVQYTTRRNATHSSMLSGGGVKLTGYTENHKHGGPSLRP